MYPVRWFVILLALGATLSAQTGVKISPRDAAALIAPKTAVRRYCEMDAQGFRLTPETARRIQAVTNADELAARQSFEVITHYEIASARPNARGVAVTVLFETIGHFESRVGYVPDTKSQEIEFQAIPVDSDWKIVADDALVLKARVTKLHALRWLREQATKEKDPDSLHALQQAIKDLSY
jgi:hypothetical protein